LSQARLFPPERRLRHDPTMGIALDAHAAVKEAQRIGFTEAGR
jgi:hypothetical protein